MQNKIDVQQIKTCFQNIQQQICQELELIGQGKFLSDTWESKLGHGLTNVIADGDVIEKGGVNFSHVASEQLPSAATAGRPELAGLPFQAMGVSLVIHPKNPYVPTTHANIRFFITEKENEQFWWFGGGFDLTPYYPFMEDIIHWHQTAKNICDQYHPDWYKRFKAWCDDYFFLPHRNETRGVGGVFYDDLNQPDFESCFSFTQAVGEGFCKAYIPIIQRRKDHEYGEREREFQLLRRGRYVEYNLVYDRGTRFGLQSNGRTESILMSMPSTAKWNYNWQPEKGSEEEKFCKEYLKPRDWLID